VNRSTTSTSTPRSVFISHASKNVKVADEIRGILEARGVSCWIAPRDIPPGQQYGTSIIDGISNSSVFLLLLTHESNVSPAVQNEVERAFGYQKTIIPVRISDVKPGKEIEFFVSNAQWVDAIYQPLKRRMDEVAAIVQAIEMSAKPPPIQPDRKTLLGSVEKFFERAFRHKTISFITGFLILASLVVLGIYLQSRSMGSLNKASSAIQQSGTEITAAASTIKDSSEKVSAFGGKVDVLKKETSEDPKKELANMGLMWDESVFLNSLDDPKITNLFLKGGMKLSKELFVSNLAFGSIRPGALNMLMPGSGVESYGDCASDFSRLHVLLPRIFHDEKKRQLFTALCNPDGELTKTIQKKYAVLVKTRDEGDKKIADAKKPLTDAEKELAAAEKNFQQQQQLYSKKSNEQYDVLLNPKLAHLEAKLEKEREFEGKNLNLAKKNRDIAFDKLWQLKVNFINPEMDQQKMNELEKTKADAAKFREILNMLTTQ
jgi:hypothetical protein